ncbi:MAG: DJ-1/PfpI family protein [Steroidobacteraceae bacterium]|nr:DJ-1/PfpI family protein [Steroidobacteraceae bacterium]
MRKRLLVQGGLGIVALFGAIGAGWILSLPPPPAVEPAPPIAPDEADTTVGALKPPKRERPVIAIIGLNDGTETTDYLMPYGILRRADVADVVALAIEPGPVKLYPALSVEPQATVAEFDARYPEGADYVIVPAMRREDDPAMLDWLQRQAHQGAIVIGVCVGAKVVGNAGLLDGKRATTHWYYREQLRNEHPAIRYVPDRRVVVDGRVVTTTGISASMPMALTLIEAIAGREKALEVARDIGLPQWDLRHSSSAFTFTRPFAVTALRNWLAFWAHEQLGMELVPGMDEVSLALFADGWSRTFRSRAVTFSSSADPVSTSNGLRILPDKVATSWPAERRLAPLGTQPPAQVLDDTLQRIAMRYGQPTRNLVAMQMEYTGQPSAH